MAAQFLPSDPAQSIRVLQNSQALAGFDPVKLAGIRAERERGAADRFAMLAGETKPSLVAERERAKAQGQNLEYEMKTDPFTGDQAQEDERYFDPTATRRREDENRLKRLLAGEPNRVSGLAARDVAAIHATEADHKAGSGGEGWAEPTVSIPDPYGTGGTYPVPRRIAADPAATKQFIDQFRANGIGGSQGQGDRTTINAMNSLIDVLGETWRTGEAAKWKGLGPIDGTLGSFLYRKAPLGIGAAVSTPQEEALRNQVGRVKAREAFGEGGKAFTGTEEELVDQFIASLSDNPSVTRTRLSQSMQHAAIQLMNRGVSREAAEAKIRGALGGAADVDLMESIFGPTGTQPTAGGGPGGAITDPNWGAR